MRKDHRNVSLIEAAHEEMMAQFVSEVKLLDTTVAIARLTAILNTTHAHPRTFTDVVGHFNALSGVNTCVD